MLKNDYDVLSIKLFGERYLSALYGWTNCCCQRRISSHPSPHPGTIIMNSRHAWLCWILIPISLRLAWRCNLVIAGMSRPSFSSEQCRLKTHLLQMTQGLRCLIQDGKTRKMKGKTIHWWSENNWRAVVECVILGGNALTIMCSQSELAWPGTVWCDSTVF